MRDLRPQDRLALVLRSRIGTAGALARVARRTPVRGAAARLERSVDLHWVEPPPPVRPFHLRKAWGRDEVALEVAQHGWAAFERPLPAVLVGLVSRLCRGGLFADVGANTGYYSLLGAACAGDVTVDAFEPYPPALELLRDNVRANRARRVRVHGVALSAEPGNAELFIPNDTHGMVEKSSSLNPTFSWHGMGSSVPVAVTTLDALYPAGQQAPSVLKIDVESFEADVLRGGLAMIRRHRPVVIVELLHHADPQPLEDIRSEIDYVDLRLRPDRAVLGPHVEPDAEAWNHLWCPREALDWISPILQGAGLPATVG